MKWKWALVWATALLSPAACKDRSEAPVTAAASSPTLAPAPAPAPASPSAPSSTTFDPKDMAFCQANFGKMLTCFEDDSFWQIFSTMYFAYSPQGAQVAEADKQLWIGMRKDDLMSLKADKALEQNCVAMLTHTKGPTAAQRAQVDTARAKSCPDFASAFGGLLFAEGVFHEMK